MIWFILMVVLSLVFFKLGVFSVLLAVLKAAVTALLFVLGGFGLYALWKRVRRKGIPSWSRSLAPRTDDS